MKSKNTTHIHDGFFKSSMSDVNVMKSAVKNYMPEAIKKHFHLDTLSLCSGSYVDDNLKQSQSDILYSVECTNGEPGYMYLLWEHQSTADWKMPLRLLNYSLRIMEQHMAQGHDKLPLVIPTVVYNGATSYRFSADLFDMFENPDLARKLMFKPFNLIDLPNINDEAIARGFWEAWPFMILKHMRGEDFSEQTLKLIDVSQRISKEGGESHLQNMLRFTIETLQVADPVKLDALLEKTPQEVGKKMATAAQIWQQRGHMKGHAEGCTEGFTKGRIEGLTKGRTKGRTEGRTEGLAGVALNMIRNNYNVETISKLTALSPKQIKALMEASVEM